MYAAVDSRASELACSFQMETERLWDAERSIQKPDSLTSTIALHILSLGCLCQGKNEAGLGFLAEGANMGKRMHLFGATATPSRPNAGESAQIEAKARAQCAWGTFTWLM